MLIPNGKVTTVQTLFPVSLIAFVVFIMLAFQSTQVLRDRDLMSQARDQQDKAVEEAARVQTQLDALAVGTLNLSEKGDKNATAIIDRMKKLGITVNPNPPNGTSSMSGQAPMERRAPPAMAAPSAPPAPPPSEP